MRRLAGLRGLPRLRVVGASCGLSAVRRARPAGVQGRNGSSLPPEGFAAVFGAGGEVVVSRCSGSVSFCAAVAVI